MRYLLAILINVIAWGNPASSASMDEEVTTAVPLVEEAYRFLHEHPELGKQETQAQLYLTSKLRAPDHLSVSMLSRAAAVAGWPA